MKWFWRKDLPSIDDEDGLAQAKQERAEAERRLRESRIAARQVRQVSITAREIRADNQFSIRLSEAFGSRPQNG